MTYRLQVRCELAYVDFIRMNAMGKPRISTSNTPTKRTNHWQREKIQLPNGAEKEVLDHAVLEGHVA